MIKISSEKYREHPKVVFLSKFNISKKHLTLMLPALCHSFLFLSLSRFCLLMAEWIKCRTMFQPPCCHQTYSWG